jgi:archaeal flagellin FlaB
MILVAGITASVLIQTMNSLQQQAMKTGMDTIREISSGVKITHVSGYYNGVKISQIAIFISPIAGSEDIDLTSTYLSLSDSSKQAILSYNTSCYNNTVSDGLFDTINASNLSESEYGIIVIRDIDNSCSATLPIINHEDMIVLLVNTTKCFSGLGTRTTVQGTLNPEFGISGVMEFTTPGTFSKTIIDLQS